MDKNRDFKKQLAIYSSQNKLERERVIDLYVREGLIDRFSQSFLNQKYVLKGASAFLRQ